MDSTRDLPKVDCPLANRDGNAFSVLGCFSRAARKAGWTQVNVNTVVEEATAGDYNHLLQTILRHCR